MLLSLPQAEATDSLAALKKRFPSVKNDIVELDFDWNIGDLYQRSTWISIKDSEFTDDSSCEKGFRYLVLKVDYVDSNNRTLSYGTGDRDIKFDNVNIPPANQKPLFSGAEVSPDTWFNVNVTLDFITKTTTFTLTNKVTNETTGKIEVAFPDDLVAANNLDFGALSFVSHGAGNNSTEYEDYPVHLYIDNFNVYSSSYDTSDTSYYDVTVTNGSGSGKYKEGDMVTVRAGKTEIDGAVNSWTTEPSDIVMIQDELNPFKWTFKMPARDVGLTPNYSPYDIAVGYQYYFKSDYYSVYDNSDYNAPQVQFTAEEADFWESSDTGIASVSVDIDPSIGYVTAGAAGSAIITARSGGENGTVVGTAEVYVPIVSEDFENSPDEKWSITAGGDSGSASSNPGLSSSSTDFKVVTVPDADGVNTNAFEFSSGRGDATFRCVQKKIEPVKQDIAELNFDWNIGDMSRKSTWLSIKDSEFASDNSSEKGFRYLALKVDYVDMSNRILSYGTGNRDASNTNGGNDFIWPDNPVQLFNGSKVPPNTWYNVSVILNFITQTTTFSLTNKITGDTTGKIEVAFSDDLIAAGNLDFSAVSLISAGAGDNSTDYKKYPVRLYVDNFNVYGKDYPSYNVTVTNGTGSGSYKAGTTVTITADTPEEGQAVRNWTTMPTGIAMTQDPSDPLKWTFKMPDDDVILTANYGPEYEIVIGAENTGGAGRIRKLTVFGNLKDKYLVLMLTEMPKGGTNTETKASMVILNASKDATISYQSERTRVEVWLTDGVPNFNGDISDVTKYTTASVDPVPDTP